MYVCREDVTVPVSADNNLYGAKVALGRESNFEVAAAHHGSEPAPIGGTISRGPSRSSSRRSR